MSGYSFGPTSRRFQPRRPDFLAPAAPYRFAPSGGAGYSFGRPGVGGTGFSTRARFKPGQVIGTGTADFQSQQLAVIDNLDAPDWAKSQMRDRVLHGISHKYSRPLQVLSGV